LLKRQLETFIYVDDSLFSVSLVPENEMAYYLEALDRSAIPYQTGFENLAAGVASAQRASTAIIPDTLLNLLKRSQVDYLIRGNLRLNPAQKTNRVINTVHRYMHFIEWKYPGSFSQVFKVGEDNDEPAYLFQINWDRIEQQRNN
jgi:hypothetical protein